ncbi:MAG TPA: hypothetical protein DCQ47_04740 [Gammaproteobacteria bacterium]|nr:hypothetical protein [Gammaproteobacteria bacterium]
MSRIFPLIALLLTGCNELEQAIAPNQNDLDRVAGILNQPTEKIDVIPFSQVGSPEVRLSDTRIRFANALELAECGLLPLIAERNSSLGKQKQESSRLIYEWKIRAGLSRCSQLRDKEWFQLAAEAKQHDVEAAIIELLTKSEESDRIHAKVSPPFETLNESTIVYTETTREILQTLTRALSNADTPDKTTISDFEESLKSWGSTQHHGTIHKAISQTLAWISSANSIQKRAIESGGLCPMGTPTEHGRNLQAFIQGFFKNKLQPKISSLSRALESLERQWSVLPLTLISNDELIDSLIRLPAGTRNKLSLGISSHVQQWQLLLQDCSLAPRAETTNSKQPSRSS